MNTSSLADHGHGGSDASGLPYVHRIPGLHLSFHINYLTLPYPYPEVRIRR